MDGVVLSADLPREAREWRNHRDVWRWCRQYTLIDQLSHAQWEQLVSEDRSIKMFGIQNLDKEYVGVCGLTSIDHVNQKAEFSLYIAPEHQRKGYGEQALRVLCKHGFNDFNLNRIWGETYEGNPALAMFERIGFQVEGKQRQAYFRDGKFIDSWIVSLLRGEFGG